MYDPGPDDPSLDEIIDAYIRYGLHKHEDDFWG